MKNVLCILANKFEEIEAIGVYAILSRGKVNIEIASLNDEILKGKYNLSITNLLSLNNIDLDKYDSLFIAGGGQYLELENSDKFKKIILDFYNKNKLIGAICAAPTILGHLGLLKNKKYTCFNSMNEEFGGTYIDHYYVIDNNLITGKSAAATIEFALAYLELLTDKNNLERVKEEIYYYHK